METWGRNVLMVRPIGGKNGPLDSEQTPWGLEASPILSHGKRGGKSPLQNVPWEAAGHHRRDKQSGSIETIPCKGHPVPWVPASGQRLFFPRDARKYHPGPMTTSVTSGSSWLCHPEATAPSGTWDLCFSVRTQLQGQEGPLPRTQVPLRSLTAMVVQWQTVVAIIRKQGLGKANAKVKTLWMSSFGHLGVGPSHVYILFSTKMNLHTVFWNPSTRVKPIKHSYDIFS